MELLICSKKKKTTRYNVRRGLRPRRPYPVCPCENYPLTLESGEFVR
jgi:hypothetical protein